MVNITLFEFQEDASLKLLELTENRNSKQTILMKAPTGSGKTIILIDFIEKYINDINMNSAFIWLCPGAAELEEQSKEKMMKYSPDIKTQDLNDALLSGFEPGTATFINWELVTKKDNLAIIRSEKKNLFERIADAHRKRTEFIIIIDEEHQNNTSKANNIINAFSAKNIIRTSATVVKRSNVEFFEIDETEVIASGLITKAIYVNEGVKEDESIKDDYDILLELASNKQKEIAKRYEDIGENIRPLVLIQFPNAQPKSIKLVENKLEKMGYTYDNGMVAIWMSDRKENITDDFNDNNGQPIFLLMKLATSTGWDCPRAKILVKLREGMSEQFTIQTVGRIRRMPQARHYEDDLLDFCYIYTFDEKYKEGLFNSVEKAYETRRLFLKDKCKTFTLVKETRDLDFAGLGEREVYKKIKEYLKKKYNLSTDKKANKIKLEASGYIFGEELIREVLKGKFVKTSSLADNDAHYITTRTLVNTHSHGIYMLNSIDTIKKSISMQNRAVKAILERLFRKGTVSFDKILSLPTKEFYAFVINNRDKLKEDFKEVTTDMIVQNQLILSPKKEIFKIPEQDFFKYDSTVKNEVEYLSNAYENYTSGNTTSLIRSTSEMLFEKHCEKRDDIYWVYKNGDSGQQYFSIVYIDALQKQWLFYADYIVMKKDESIWIIETKGGEARGIGKNIDLQIENKFYAFKKYADSNSKEINWGFVRDKDNELYINNTEYYDDMNNDNWVALEEKF